LEHALSKALQHASAAATGLLFRLSPVPYYREGLTFHMPRLTVEVAIECSGIRSSVVLFITSLMASHLFLQQRWKKAVLVLSVVPIGILRNAVRILTISVLTVYVHQGVIEGPLHRRGGPLFFVLSLAVLFALLFLLRRIGRGRRIPSAS
jgi:exosortase